GSGSSRDWAAKGTNLLGIEVVMAESFERIHRSNLVQMGVLPLEFTGGQSAVSLGLTGQETYSFTGITGNLVPGKTIKVTAETKTDETTVFDARARLDFNVEIAYYQNGGILQYVLRGFLK